MSVVISIILIIYVHFSSGSLSTEDVSSFEGTEIHTYTHFLLVINMGGNVQLKESRGLWVFLPKKYVQYTKWPEGLDNFECGQNKQSHQKKV